MDEMMSAIRRGKFVGIAQSEAFIARVVQLKYWIDCVLIKAEEHGVFLPTYVTAAQRTLPIHPATGIGDVAGSGFGASVGGRLQDNPMSARYVHRHTRSVLESG